jgi:hypothetical protein
LAGVTAIDWITAAVTVRVVDPLTVPIVALIDEVPICKVLARPPEAIVATVGVADAHVTWLVRSCVELSDNVPVAVNCFVSPLATLGFAGVTAIDCTTGAVTVSVVDPLILPSVALIDDVPMVRESARPAAEIVATAVVADCHVTMLVRSSVEWSEKVPVAVNCCVSPFGTLGLAGVTFTEIKTPGVTVSVVESERLPNVAVIFEVPTISVVANPAPEIVATEGVADAHVTWLVRS